LEIWLDTRARGPSDRGAADIEPAPAAKPHRPGSGNDKFTVVERDKLGFADDAHVSLLREAGIMSKHAELAVAGAEVQAEAIVKLRHTLGQRGKVGPTCNVKSGE
jgi:hypothetical protein